MTPRMAFIAVPAALGLFFALPVIIPAVLVGDTDDAQVPVLTVTSDASGCSMFCDDPDTVPDCAIICTAPEDVPECTVFCDAPQVPVCTLFCGEQERAVR